MAPHAQSIVLELGVCADLVREANVVLRGDVFIHSIVKLPCVRSVKRRAEVFLRIEPSRNTFDGLI